MHTPPDAQRVVRRAHCFCAVVARAFIDAHPEQLTSKGINSKIIPWLELTRAGGELEGWEASALSSTLGSIDPSQRDRASWLSEALGTLAWALNRYEPPPHDVAADAQAVTARLEFLEPLACELNLVLRSPIELLTARRRAFALHWRLSKFNADQQPIDFAAALKGLSIDPSVLIGVPLSGDDLSVGGRAFAKTPPEAIAQASRICLERYRALVWLSGDEPVFSRVQTDPLLPA